MGFNPHINNKILLIWYFKYDFEILLDINSWINQVFKEFLNKAMENRKEATLAMHVIP